MCSCKAKWKTGESHCSACCMTFATLANFDDHRTGGMDARRCLTPSEAGLTAEAKDHAIVWGRSA